MTDQKQINPDTLIDKILETALEYCEETKDNYVEDVFGPSDTRKKLEQLIKEYHQKSED